LELIPAITPQELALVDAKQLPPQAKVIVNLIGIEDAWTLLSDRGGKEITVPLGERTGAYLHQLLPESSAAALIKRFAGMRLTLPKTDKIVIQIRNHRIYQAKAHGATTTHLARRYQLTKRSIILICTRMNAGNLF